MRITGLRRGFDGQARSSASRRQAGPLNPRLQPRPHHAFLTNFPDSACSVRSVVPRRGETPRSHRTNGTLWLRLQPRRIHEIPSAASTVRAPRKHHVNFPRLPPQPHQAFLTNFPDSACSVRSPKIGEGPFLVGDAFRSNYSCPLMSLRGYTTTAHSPLADFFLPVGLEPEPSGMSCAQGSTPTRAAQASQAAAIVFTRAGSFEARSRDSIRSASMS